MKNNIMGIITFLCQIFAIIVGYIGIAAFSSHMAVLYVAGCAVSFVLFVSVFCTKCPIKEHCVHVLHGVLTRCMPDRAPGPYSKAEVALTMIYFCFLAFFPQYWLIADIRLLVLFWVVLLGGLALNGALICRGCGNVHCPMRKG